MPAALGDAHQCEGKQSQHENRAPTATGPSTTRPRQRRQIFDAGPGFIHEIGQSAGPGLDYAFPLSTTLFKVFDMSSRFRLLLPRRSVTDAAAHVSLVYPGATRSNRLLVALSC